MERPRRRRRETAADLVLALSAGLEASDSLPNAVLDPLVVASLEVQRVKVGDASPIAPVQRVAATKADRSGDRPLLVTSQDNEQVGRQTAADDVEELAIQIGCPSATMKSMRVKFIDRVPFIGRYGVAFEMVETNPRLSDSAPLPLGLFSFGLVKTAEKLVKVCVVVVVPMKLAAFPLE